MTPTRSTLFGLLRKAVDAPVVDTPKPEQRCPRCQAVEPYHWDWCSQDEHDTADGRRQLNKDDRE